MKQKELKNENNQQPHRSTMLELYGTLKKRKKKRVRYPKSRLWILS